MSSSRTLIASVSLPKWLPWSNQFSCFPLCSEASSLICQPRKLLAGIFFHPEAGKAKGPYCSELCKCTVHLELENPSPPPYTKGEQELAGGSCMPMLSNNVQNFTELLTVIIQKHFRHLFTGTAQPKEMLRPLTKNSNLTAPERDLWRHTRNKHQLWGCCAGWWTVWGRSLHNQNSLCSSVCA